MQRSFTLGRFLGIPIALDYSWLLVFILVTWSLAGLYFPQEYPDWPQLLYLAVGLVSSLLFFTSVVLHELGHSLVARHFGIPVRNITLFIFGGVAQIGREPPGPVAEFLVGIAGPLVSLALASLFGIVATVSRGWTPVQAGATYLAYINALLGGFNLIPGFPLDGGRVFRAFLWTYTGNFRQATEIAVRVGRFMAAMLILSGVWQIFSGQLIDGLWIAFLGWFLDNAATSSIQQITFQQLLAGHTVGEIMTRDCQALPANLTLEQAVHDYVLTTGRRCFPVLDGDHVLGLVTLHEIKAIPRSEWPETTVEKVMTPLSRLRTTRPDEGLWRALEEMTEEDVNQLPVMENGRLAGMLGRDNVLTFIRLRAELGV